MKLKTKKSVQELMEFSILNIDKPSGPTSFNVSDFVRKKLGLRKTSHFGTLDPKVTGVLPVALNRACKLTGFFIQHDKEYVGIMRIHKEIELEKIKKMIKKKFLGKIKQTPPVKSRVKRQEREREIKKFELLEKKDMQGQKPLCTSPKHGQSKDILFRVECQGGTYIRKLIDDLGKELGIGAHMLELRRVRAGIFSETDKEFINLYDLDDKEKIKNSLISGEKALKQIFPVIQVKKESVKKLLTGKPIFKEDVAGKLDKERFVAFHKERFIGVYKKVDKIAKPEFVFQTIKD